MKIFSCMWYICRDVKDIERFGYFELYAYIKTGLDELNVSLLCFV